MGGESIQKQLSNQHPKIELILVPTWLRFWMVSGPTSEPNGHEIAPNIASQNEQQNDPLSHSFEVDLGWILASSLNP